MTDEDFAKMDWRVTSAEMRVAGMFLIFAGHEYLGGFLLVAPDMVSGLKKYLQKRRLKTQVAA